MSLFWRFQALQSPSSVVMAATGVTALLQTRSQDSRQVQQNAADILELKQQRAADALELKQQLAALEKEVRQLKQAAAASSGWFSSWR